MSELERLQTDNARLREVCEKLVEANSIHEHKIDEDTLLDALDMADAYLSAPADDWLTRHDREVVEQFVERVNRATEFAMEKTGKLEGAHYAGMQLELAAIREGE